MDKLTILGLTAALLTSFGGLPQTIKTLKTGKTRDLSFGMYLLLNLGVILWIIYGILKGDLPVIVANLLALLFLGTIFAVIVKNKIKGGED
ncbi:hypothetical protein D6764_03750 [Candidatus Woesearchaeota archaeon]|nr:MAG: hypothetical protein D6764_03750 [Candidatus Woesearchaeota archaeon]